MKTERIKQLEAAVERAKQNVRSTLSISELSKENIKDLIKDVQETNELLSKLFGGDEGLSSNGRFLLTKLKELQEQAIEADSEKIKELVVTIKEIMSVSNDLGGKEGDLINQVANNLLKALTDAKSHARKGERSKGGPMHGAGLMTTIFGSKVGGWMGKMPGDSGASSSKRRKALLLQEMADKELKEASGSVSTDKETPSEKEETRREGEVRQKAIEVKEDVVVDLLKEIHAAVGAGGLIVMGGGGGGGGSEGGTDPGGLFGKGILTLDNALMGMMAAGPIGKVGSWIKRILPWGKGTAAAASASKLTRAGSGGWQIASKGTKGYALAGTASRAAKLGLGARSIAGIGRFAGGLISFGVTEAVYQIMTGLIAEQEEATRAGQSYLNLGPMDLSQIKTPENPNASGKVFSGDLRAGGETDWYGNMVAGTGYLMYDPATAKKGETAQQGLARGQLMENEEIIISMLRKAATLFGNKGSDDTEAVAAMKEAQDYAKMRAKIAKTFGVENSQQAHDLLKFSKKGYLIISQAMDSISGNMGYWYQDWGDKSDVRATKSLMNVFDPARTAQDFLSSAAKVSIHTGDNRTTEGKMMSELGFKSRALRGSGLTRALAESQDVTLNRSGTSYGWHAQTPTRLLQNPGYIRPITDIEANARQYAMDKSAPIIIQGDGQSSNNMTVTNSTNIHEDGAKSNDTSLTDRQRYNDYSSSYTMNPSNNPRQ